MQVVRHDLRRDGEQPLEVAHALLEGGERLRGLEVADVVRDPGAPPARQAERALELGAAGQHVAAGRERQREHARHGAARAAQRQRPAAGHAQHGVVDARLDRAVVVHDEVGDRRRAAPARRRPRRRSARRRRCRSSSPAARRRRPAAGDGAGCRAASRRARPSAAPPPPPRARRGGGGRARSAGRAPPAAPFRPPRARPARAPRPDHRAISANGFSSRCLRGPQPRDRLLVARQAREMEPADPLDRDDAAARAAARRRRRARARGAARTRGRRWAGRGSGGSSGRRTRPRRPRTS